VPGATPPDGDPVEAEPLEPEVPGDAEPLEPVVPETDAPEGNVGDTVTGVTDTPSSARIELAVLATVLPVEASAGGALTGATASRRGRAWCLGASAGVLAVVET
jgi:hypothetical protein